MLFLACWYSQEQQLSLLQLTTIVVLPVACVVAIGFMFPWWSPVIASPLHTATSGGLIPPAMVVHFSDVEVDITKL
jgi:hypothetical protein